MKLFWTPRPIYRRPGIDEIISLALPQPDYRPPRPRGMPGVTGPSGGADYWIAAIGGLDGFLEPMKKAIAAYIGEWGAEADIEPLRAAIEQRFAEADAGERSPATLNR